MEFIEIEPEDLFRGKDFTLVDVRSPSEFQEFHIPGAVNIPIFDDDEKRLIGLIYRTRGQETAFEKGKEIGEKKLENIFQAFKNLAELGKPIVVYCWRGGMRSRGVCSALSKKGLKLYRLRGGYRAYRNYILSRMEEIIKGLNAIVITGKTGTGKTRLIEMLRSDGMPAVNLENLAKHRGSLFGNVGIRERISQKMFDSLLFEELRKITSNHIIIEDESRRIGNLHIPESLWKKKQEGIFIEIEIPIEERVKIILEDYTSSDGWEEDAERSLLKLSKYMGPQKSRIAFDLFRAGRYRELVEFLIVTHYDKKYRVFKKPDYVIQGNEIAQCYEQFRDLYFEITDESKVQNRAVQR